MFAHMWFYQTRSNNHLGNPHELPSKTHFSYEKNQLYKTNNFFLRKLGLVNKIICCLILSAQNKEEKKGKKWVFLPVLMTQTEQHFKHQMQSHRNLFTRESS